MAGSVAFGLSGLPVRWFLTAQLLNRGIWAAVGVSAGYLLREAARHVLRGGTPAAGTVLTMVVASGLLRRSNR